jgi:hypothetical protein
MQVVKPEWVSLQAQFTPLALNERISRIQDELEALQHEIEAQHFEALNAVPDSLQFMLRKIQRYVEWTVPDLVPERAEEAEILVNIGRFTSRLVLQETRWNVNNIEKEIERQILQIEAILDSDRANSAP